MRHWVKMGQPRELTAMMRASSRRNGAQQRKQDKRPGNVEQAFEETRVQGLMAGQGRHGVEV